MSAVLRLDSWAGREQYRCEIVGETPTRYRIRLLEPARLPGNRNYQAGDVVLVPKHAIKLETKKDTNP